MNFLSSLYRKFRLHAAGMKGPLRYWLARLGNSPDAYLKLVRRGVIHVGANDGQARQFYAQNRLKAVFVEAIPELYEKLSRNIAAFPGQQAINALITERDGDTHIMHVSNNAGLSSSIFDLHQHKDIWPDVHYVREIPLISSTLKTALDRAGVNIADYEVLVMDTQGSELLVLKGAEHLLPHFNYIKSEAADFEIYKDCATVAQIRDFLEPRGYDLIRQDEFARRPEGGACYELLFARRK